MWTGRAGGGSTSRCICGAPTAPRARSSTSSWRTCPRCPRRRWQRSRQRWPGGKWCRPGPGSRSLARPHGHVAAVMAQATVLGPPRMLGPACRERDLALALVISRVVRPKSRLSTLSWWADTTLGVDLDVAAASTDEVYQAMDWLLVRQDRIEAHAGRAAPRSGEQPGTDGAVRSVLVVGGGHALPARGTRLLLRWEEGQGADRVRGCSPTRPGVRSRSGCFPGDTADPVAFVEAVTIVRDRFTLEQMVMVGDRGMITAARIDALTDADQGDMSWITALRAPAIAKLAAEDGPLQMSLFDQHDPRRDHPPGGLPERAPNRLPQPSPGRPNEPANATPCGPPRRPRSPRPSLPSPPGGYTARTRSGSRSAS
jgi:hypothetical protein